MVVKNSDVRDVTLCSALKVTLLQVFFSLLGLSFHPEDGGDILLSETFVDLNQII
jgi:hypothetical protein